MAAVGNLAFNLGSLIPLGNAALNANDAPNPAPQNMGRHRGGSLGFMIDQSGLKMFRYIQNRDSSAMAVGSLASCVGTVATTNGGMATSVTSPVGDGVSKTRLTCSGLTANQHIGGLLYIEVTTSNLAPQGESAPVVANSATAIDVDSKYPFSAALAASGITAKLLGTYNSHASAAGDYSTTVRGVIVGSDGIDTTNFGWAQSWGYVPQAIFSGAITLGAPLIAGTANLATAVGAARVAGLLLGWAPAVVTTASVVTGPAQMTLDFGAFPFNTSSTGIFSF